MGVLQKAELRYLPADLREAEEAVGGRWTIPNQRQPDEIVAECRALGVRSISIGRADELEFLRQLADLEFLYLGDAGPVTALGSLRKLRSLSIVSWKGELDVGAFPELEWLGIGEAPPATLASLRGGHPNLRSLGVGGYPHPDLRPLGALHLERLTMGGSRKLVSLAGIEAHGASLRRLELDRCPNLESLGGIEALDHLEYLELSNLPRITRLDWVHSLPKLRFLNVFDLKNVESLAPLARHPTLEFVGFGRIKDLDLDPLTEIPNLKLFNTGFYRWNRDLKTLPYAHYEPAGSPREAEWTAMAIG